MFDFITDFVRALAEATENTGTQLSSQDFANALNNAGIKNTRGGEYKGGRGPRRVASVAANECLKKGDYDGYGKISNMLKQGKK